MVSTITKEEYMQMYAIIGAAQMVHSTLGRGLEELIYQEALELELTERNITFERQKLLHTYYKQYQLHKTYQADLYSDGIMIELKSVEKICPEHRAQLMNYMRITKTTKGLLINFGEKSLRVERYIYQKVPDNFALLTEANLQQYITT